MFKCSGLRFNVHWDTRFRVWRSKVFKVWGSGNAI